MVGEGFYRVDERKQGHYERNTNPNSLTMAYGERFKGYADGICKHFKKLLQPYPEYWQFWVEKEMPWIAYSSLYYDAFTGRRFFNEFNNISSLTRKNINCLIVQIA